MVSGTSAKRTTAARKIEALCVWFAVLAVASLAAAQVQVGENTQLHAGALLTAGYAGDFGNDIQSSHSVNFGASGNIDGYYYNPNFLNFSVTPYYNQSKADSDFQSLTSASGVAATANFFTGSHFPGSVSYRYDYNTTGNFGLAGVPNFTTQGNGQGFGINWSAILPGLPSLSVGYQQGSGSGTLYGTSEKTSSSQNNLNVRSSYRFAGFNLNAYYDHNTLDSELPQFLIGSPTGTGEDTLHSTGNDFGIGASRNIPWMNGQFYASYTHSTLSSDYLATGQSATNASYTTDLETAGANFHPNNRLGLFVNESFTNNLSGYLNQGLVNNGSILPPVNLGTNSYSFTAGGGANYEFTNHLWAQAQTNFYDQYYFGKSYSGSLISGSVNYGKKLFDMFTFSAGVVDISSNFGNNSIGFIGTVNYFRKYGQWETSGNFSYAQNVQSVLVTETTSYYNYSANLHRRFSSRVQWTAAFNGNHSGLSSDKNSSNHSEAFSTSLSLRRVSFTAQYLTGTGNSILTNSGLVPLPPTPGVPNADLINYQARSYGGGVSWTPIRRLVLTGTYSRSLSNTLANSISSKNNTEILYGQLQYRLRRIGLLAGYTRFTQGISATGQAPGTVTSYYGGISRWFDFF